MMARRLRPELERVEARQLLSVTAILAMHHPAVHAAASSSTAAGVDGGNGLVLGQGQPNQYLMPTGTPTARQQARSQFKFTFSGAYIQTPGRYSDEATFVRIVGVGRSTYFLHGDIQLNAIVPTDPARTTAGVASSFDRNNNANSSFGFDLTGSTADLDSSGRPTHFNAVTDPNLSAGLFVASQSQATVQIRYFPNGKVGPHGYSQGRATVVIRGTAYTLGTGNTLGGPIAKSNTLDPREVSV